MAYSPCTHNLLGFMTFVSDYGVEKYNLGSGFGHFGIAVEDVSLHSHEKMSKLYLGNFIQVYVPLSSCMLLFTCICFESLFVKR